MHVCMSAGIYSAYPFWWRLFWGRKTAPDSGTGFQTRIWGPARFHMMYANKTRRDIESEVTFGMSTDQHNSLNIDHQNHNDPTSIMVMQCLQHNKILQAIQRRLQHFRRPPSTICMPGTMPAVIKRSANVNVRLRLRACTAMQATTTIISMVINLCAENL